MPSDGETPETLCLFEEREFEDLAWDCAEILDCLQRTSWRPSGADDWPAERWAHGWCIFSVRDEASLSRKPSAGERAKKLLGGRQPEVPAAEMTPQWVVDVVLRSAYGAGVVDDLESARWFMDPSHDMHGDPERGAWCLIHDALTFIKAQSDEALRGDSALVINSDDEFAATYAIAPRVTKKWFKERDLAPEVVYTALWAELMRRHIDRTIGLADPRS